MSLEEQESLTASLRGRRCWVVGCGFLGSCLLDACRRAGMVAIGIDRELPADICGDAAEPSVIAAARALVEPEFIFCSVATHGGDEAAYLAAYRGVTRALLALSPSAVVLFCSSSSVYGGQGGELVAEDSPCNTHSARGQVLLSVEDSVLAAGGCVARLVPLYGGGRCELLRRHMQREPELPGEDARVLNYVHRLDAARALLSLAAAGVSGVVNVCAESFTKGEVYAGLARLTGGARVGMAASGGRRGVSDQRVSSARLRSLGWCPQQRFLDWASRHFKDWDDA